MYERDFTQCLSDNNQDVVITTFNTTSRYLDDLIYIDKSYYEQMVSQIYHSGLQLNRAISSITDAQFLDLVTIIGLQEYWVQITS